MGLCIGFSFRECSSLILSYLEQVITRFKGPNDRNVIGVKNVIESKPTFEYAEECSRFKCKNKLLRQEERLSSVEQELKKLNEQVKPILQQPALAVQQVKENK